MRPQPWLYAWALLLAASGMAHAHGMFHEIGKREAVVINAEFDDGEPVSYAQVKVYSPGGKEIEHQNGRTDKNGCFAFVPDRSGEWEILVDGGMGHRIQAAFAVNEASEIRETQDTGRACPTWQRVATGLSLIFGVSGLIMYVGARKLHRQVR